MSHRSVSLIVVGVALLAGLVLGRFLHLPPQEVERVSPQLPAIGLQHASIILRHHGQKQAEVRAGRVEVSRDLRYAAFADSPTVVVFSEGQEAFRVQGSRIVLDRHTGDVSVQGPVDVSSPQGARLVAGTVRWVNAAQQLVFERSVTMTLGDQELTAEELTVDVGQQLLDFSGGVNVAFRLKGLNP